MASGLLDIGSSALLGYQRALDTVGHNVANVNTAGYTRQRVELVARPPQGNGAGFIGTGVDVATIQRSFNQFATDDLRITTTNAGEMDTLASLSGTLDSLLADENSGLTPALNSFFNAIQGVANDPTSIAARQVMLSEADTLSARFQGLDSWMQDNRSSLAPRMQADIQDIDRLTGGIARLNQEISEFSSRYGGQPPNDLLDQRDQMILELSGKVSIAAIPQNNGEMNVFLANGQSLVLGVQSNQMGMQARSDDPGQFDVTIGAAGMPPVVITDYIKGGSLGGMLRYRDEILDPAIHELGRIAVEIGSFMNDQHESGLTLGGTQGQALFSVAAPAVFADSTNSGTVSVAFDDVSQLAADDYRLQYDGTNWSLSRLDTGATVPMSGTGSAANPFVAEGIRITVGGATAGDGYVIRPVFNGASQISSRISDPREVAVASPLHAAANTANTGTGSIASVAVTDINNSAFQSNPGQLTPEVLVRFTSAASYEVVDRASLSVIDTGSYNPATGADIFPTSAGTDFGYRLHITGSPASGDEFQVEFNAGGTGDNRNALAMAAMQSSQLMNNGTTSFNDAYGEMVANTSTRAHSARVGSDVQRIRLEQSQAAWSESAGVNLDEEAADLIRYQQAYQASAQIISVASQLFDTLIGAVRR